MDNHVIMLIPAFSPEEDWNIQSKPRQDKFQDQVIYQENLFKSNNIIMNTRML